MKISGNNNSEMSSFFLITKQEGVIPHAQHPQPGSVELIPGNEKQWFHDLNKYTIYIIKEIFLDIKAYLAEELSNGRSFILVCI